MTGGNSQVRENRFDGANELACYDTIIDHKIKILRALKFIENNIDGQLIAKNIAKVACQSQFHFQRKFSDYIGDTVSGYIRYRRLNKAAQRLQATNQSITDIAFSSGYGTSEAFTKAFKRSFGMPPSELKKRKKTFIQTLRPLNALVLRPYQQKNADPGSGKRGYGELFEMMMQVQLNPIASTWISVFPDTHDQNGLNGEDSSLLKVDFGSLRYQIMFPNESAELEFLRSGKHAILHMKGESIVYRRAQDVLPGGHDQPHKHLRRLPIRFRSILVATR